jgi:glycosyltransferase involved in cell wall biosynthesis
VNGAARACRQIDAFARRRGIPFFNAHAGPRTVLFTSGSVTTLEIKPGVFSFAVDQDMRFDPLFPRRRRMLRDALDRFRPDLIHVIAPGHFGFLGAILAHDMGVPLVASWHTNVHEYAGRRLGRMLRFLPTPLRRPLEAEAERWSLKAILRFYSIAGMLLAPNPELVEMLHARAGKPCFLMRRGVDTALFSPERRCRQSGEFVLGYVGRLTAEKNVRFLARLERELLEAGPADFRLVIVGQGVERGWLESNLTRATFTGVLTGEELSRAYADMDLFVFPSTTDAFANVVLEALASGVPAVAFDVGGPKFLIRHGINGFLAGAEEEFAARVLDIARSPGRHGEMREAARRLACDASWDRVLETLFETYRAFLAGRAALVTVGSANHR